MRDEALPSIPRIKAPSVNMGPQVTFLTVFMVLMEAAISAGPDTVEEDYGQILKNIIANVCL